MTPRASIIIVTYGQRELTAQCLRSLERCLGPRLGREFELVLVDNASPDDTPALLREWSDRATVELLGDNRNFAGGCNAGARLATGEALIFLNNDTEVTPGALEALAEQALEPGVSVAGCRLHYPDGTLQHAGVLFLRSAVLGGVAMPQHIFHHQSSDLVGARTSWECDSVTAACMAVRATSFHAVGGFDEAFRNALEDIDLCLRIRVTGGAVVYRGDIVVIHHEGASRGRGEQLWATPEKLAVSRQNDLHFCNRWAANLEQDDALAQAMWDAALVSAAEPRTLTGTDVVVAGQPGGIGYAAQEARALLARLAATGHAPAAVDHPRPNVAPRADDSCQTVLAPALRRVLPATVPWVIVTDAHQALTVDAPMIARAADVRSATPLDRVQEVWASCPAVADALAGHGLPADRIRVVAPPVAGVTPGRGGGGVLAILPVHDADRTSRLLTALSSLPSGTELTVLPPAADRRLAAELRDRLPRARLLDPIGDEARFTALAGAADAVLADDGDPFERRALLAAAAGAPALTLRRDGPAADALGPESVASPGGLSDALATVLDQRDDARARGLRSQRIHDHCGAGRLPLQSIQAVAA